MEIRPVAPNRRSRIVVPRQIQRLGLPGCFHPGSAFPLPSIPTLPKARPPRTLKTVHFQPAELDAATRATMKLGRGGGRRGWGREPRSSISVPTLAMTLWRLEGHPQERLVVTGHASPEGSASVNDRLSGARAKSIKALLIGDHNAFLQAVGDDIVPQDDDVMLRFALERFGWGCGPDSAEPSTASAAAVRAYQAAYNHTFGGSLLVDGIAGPQTRRTYWDLLEAQLRLYVGGEGRLAALREAVTWHPDHENVFACSALFPLEDVAGAPDPQWASRRAEILCLSSNDPSDRLEAPIELSSTRVSMNDIEVVTGAPLDRDLEKFELRGVDRVPWVDAQDLQCRKNVNASRCTPDPHNPFYYLDALRTRRGGVADSPRSGGDGET